MGLLCGLGKSQTGTSLTNVRGHKYISQKSVCIYPTASRLFKPHIEDVILIFVKEILEQNTIHYASSKLSIETEQTQTRWIVKGDLNHMILNIKKIKK